MTAGGYIANNPLNIRTGNDWRGEKPAEDMTPDQRRWLDRGFEVFLAPEWGIRAATILLRNYARRYGIDTVRGVIHRWAPPSENDTDAYVARVAEMTGFNPDAPLDLNDPQTVLSLLEAMITVEIGQQPYSDDVLWQGIRLTDAQEAPPIRPPMRPQTAHKAGAALVSALLTLAAIIWPEFHGLPPEHVSALGGLLSTLLVYLIPNKEKL